MNSTYKSAGVNGKIPAMQAFFVEVKSNGSLGIDNDSRVHDAQPFLKEQTEQDENLLKLTITHNSFQYTAQFILSEDSEVDTDYFDARMLLSLDDGVPQLYSITPSGVKLALNSLPAPEGNLAIPLGIRSPGNVEMTISAENLSTFINNYAVILEDKETGQLTDLRQIQSYAFTTATGGILNDRFVLHLKTGVGIGENENTIQPLVVVSNRQLSVYNLEDGLYRLQLTDVAGRNLFSGNYNPGESLSLPESVNGICLVRLTGSQKTFVQKVVIQ